MIRLWFVRLAPVILAALQLALPGAAAAAEFGTAPQPTGIAPAFELSAPARVVPREQVRLFETTSCWPASPAPLFLPVLVEPYSSRQTPACRACSSAVRQPPARAPPDRS
jgi:hypothetical protein